MALTGNAVIWLATFRRNPYENLRRLSYYHRREEEYYQFDNIKVMGEMTEVRRKKEKEEVEGTDFLILHSGNEKTL